MSDLWPIVEMTKAAHAIIGQRHARSGGIIGDDVIAAGQPEGAEQFHVEFDLERHKGASAAELIDRLMVPAAEHLAAQVPFGWRFGQLKLPTLPGSFSGLHGGLGVSVRVILTEILEPILNDDGEVVGYGDPAWKGRMDVLVAPPKDGGCG